MEFRAKYEELVNMVNTSLDNYVEERACSAKTIYTAMRYSLLGGGKRLRPILALAVSEMLGGEKDEIMPFACAVEMIHTYSLIHDDLPSMDNDDYRRGRLTNHKVYGEDIAILAGDSLLNFAFELMTDACTNTEENLLNKVKAINLISKSSGVRGMIGGQVIDIESEGKNIEFELLQEMHRLKTGALIKAPILAAATICNAKPEEIEVLETFAEKIGLAFQIKDDILDIEGDFETLGKNTGSDMANEKSTFISLKGIESSKRLLEELTQEAISNLNIFGEKSLFLRNLTQNLSKRIN